MNVRYYIEKYGMYYVNSVKFGTLCENASNDDYTYLQTYRGNPNIDLHDKIFDITDTNSIEDNIINKNLIKGRLVKEQYNSLYVESPIRVETNDVYYNYYDAINAIKKENKYIKQQNDMIANLSEYDYSVHEINKQLFHFHNKHLNKLVWDYIDNVEMTAFDLFISKGIITVRDLSKQLVPYYDKSSDRTKDICGIICNNIDYFNCNYVIVDLDTINKYNEILNRKRYKTKQDRKNNEIIDKELDDFIKNLDVI